MKFLCASSELAPNASLGFDIDGRKLFAVRAKALPTSISTAAHIAGCRWNGSRTSFSTPAPA